MGLDVASVTLNHLPRPGGYAYEFAKWLNENPDYSGYYGGCYGEGNSFGRYRRQDLLIKLKEFCESNNLDEEVELEEAELEIKEWIENLPWDVDSIILYFDW